MELYEQNIGICSHKFGADCRWPWTWMKSKDAAPWWHPHYSCALLEMECQWTWGHKLQPQLPVFAFLCSSPEEQRRLSQHLSRRSTCDAGVKKSMVFTGRVVKVFERDSGTCQVAKEQRGLVPLGLHCCYETAVNKLEG